MTAARAVAYLQIVPDRRDALGNVVSLKVAAVTMRKPERPAPRAIVAKVTLEIPSSLFAPIVVPEISIRIPETLGAAGDAELVAVVASDLCPAGCGCRIGTDDADARDCACDGPCCGPERVP